MNISAGLHQKEPKGYHGFGWLRAKRVQIMYARAKLLLLGLSGNYPQNPVNYVDVTCPGR